MIHLVDLYLYQFSVLVLTSFRCLSVTVAFYTPSYQTLMCQHICLYVCACVCVCAWGLWENECLHLLCVQCVSICTHILPHSKCPKPSECERNNKKGKKRNIQERNPPPLPHTSVVSFPSRRTFSKVSVTSARPLPSLSQIGLDHHRLATLRTEYIVIDPLLILYWSFIDGRLNLHIAFLEIPLALSFPCSIMNQISGSKWVYLDIFNSGPTELYVA